jgi:hypothetical protein
MFWCKTSQIVGVAMYVCWRYYELGPNDPPYAAKFYDCCGAEDPKAQGCRTSYHVSYDDTWNVLMTTHKMEPCGIMRQAWLTWSQLYNQIGMIYVNCWEHCVYLSFIQS